MIRGVSKHVGRILREAGSRVRSLRRPATEAASARTTTAKKKDDLAASGFTRVADGRQSWTGHFGRTASLWAIPSLAVAAETARQATNLECLGIVLITAGPFVFYELTQAQRAYDRMTASREVREEIQRILDKLNFTLSEVPGGLDQEVAGRFSRTRADILLFQRAYRTQLNPWNVSCLFRGDGLVDLSYLSRLVDELVDRKNGYERDISSGRP